MMPPVAILAGGLATRLQSIAKKVPKALLVVAGEPFIRHQIELLKEKGVSNIVVCASYLGEQIRDYLGDGQAFGASISYSFDGNRLLGTGGALRKALPLLGDMFWVLYGDAYLDTDFKAILDCFLAHEKPGLMTVYENGCRWDRSNVLYGEGRILAYDKKNPTPSMKHIDYGLALLRKDAVERIPPGEVFDLADLYANLIGKGEMLGFEAKERFYEIGSFEGLKETGEYITGRRSMSKFASKGRVAMECREYIDAYMDEVAAIAHSVDKKAIEKAVELLCELKKNEGRLFILGVGGSAGNASHAVNDFRKIAGIESYAPTDNVSELTARVNDDGWETVFENWLRGSKLKKTDCIFVLSVGGGNIEKKISLNLVHALKYAKEVGAKIIGIVGQRWWLYRAGS